MPWHNKLSYLGKDSSIEIKTTDIRVNNSFKKLIDILFKYSAVWIVLFML
jgi:hypothetical protein